MEKQDNIATEFDFEAWIAKYGLVQSTVEKLNTEGLNTEQSLQALLDSDIADLGLNIGQKALLRKAVVTLQKPVKLDLDPLQEPTLAATTKTLAKDKSINELLSSMENDLLPGVLAMSTKDTTEPGTGYRYDSSMGKTKKALRIPDFVTTNLNVFEEDRMEEIGSCKGGKIMIDRNTKPKVADITLPEWISANARILLELIDRKEIVSMDEVKQYIEYTEKIGDHARENTIASVMRFDNKFRIEQARKSWDWDRDDPFLMHNNLTKRSTPYGQKAQDQAHVKQNWSRGMQSNRQRPYDSKGKEICMQFQYQNGCRRPGCVFSHVCAIQGCEGQHPRWQHSFVTPTQSGQLRPQALQFTQPPPQYGGAQH